MSRLIAPVHINPQIKTITYPGVKKNTYQIMDYGPIFENGIELRPFVNSYGYYQIRLKDDNDQYWCPSVSRLVAWEFCPNRDINLEVDHIDTIRYNNDYRNLEWVTPQENQRRKYVNSQFRYVYYKTSDQIFKICQLLQNTDLKYTEICDMVGLNLGYNQAKGLCCDLLDKKYWTNITDKFDFSRRNMIRRAYQLSDQEKYKIFQIHMKTMSVDKTYEIYYNKPWASTNRKERDRFRHIIQRIILKFTDHP